MLLDGSATLSKLPRYRQRQPALPELSARLTDNQVHDRLVAAREALGEDEPASIRAQTIMEAAKRTLVTLQLALVWATEHDTDEVPGLLPEPPSDPSC